MEDEARAEARTYYRAAASCAKASADAFRRAAELAPDPFVPMLADFMDAAADYGWSLVEHERRPTENTPPL